MIVYLTSDKFAGVITVVYEPDSMGVNRCVGFHIDGEITKVQWQYVCSHLAYEYPSDGLNVCGVLQTSTHIEGAELIKQAKKTGQNKNIRMFCGLYKELFGVSYKVSKIDIAHANKDVPFEYDLVKLFLTEKRWWNKDRYTIENYVKNYNSLLLIKNESIKDNNGFPNEYDPDYERAVPTELISNYWAHLRSVGWTTYKNDNGKVIGMQRNGQIVLKYKNK